MNCDGRNYDELRQNDEHECAQERSLNDAIDRLPEEIEPFLDDLLSDACVNAAVAAEYTGDYDLTHHALVALIRMANRRLDITKPIRINLSGVKLLLWRIDALVSAAEMLKKVAAKGELDNVSFIGEVHTKQEFWIGSIKDWLRRIEQALADRAG